MVRGICGAQHKDRKRATNMIMMAELNETIDQLVIGACAEKEGWSIDESISH